MPRLKELSEALALPWGELTERQLCLVNEAATDWLEQEINKLKNYKECIRDPK